MGNIGASHHRTPSADHLEYNNKKLDNVTTLPTLGPQGADAETFRERVTSSISSKEFNLMYRRLQSLGEGMTGKVTKVVDRQTRERAMKMSYGYDGTQVSQITEMRREIAYLRTLDHPNISKIIDCFTDNAWTVQLVMDMCKGGNLASPSGRSRLANKEENIAAVIFQVLLAVQFIHERGIVHRDIKEENIMFVSPDGKSLHIRLIDFGLSKSVSASSFEEIKRLHTFCGTLPYMSPEVIQASYDMQSDLWSVGVLAFELLTGSLPFQGDTDRALIKKIRKARIDYSSERWTRLTPDALELVQHLLVIDPEKRWNASLALRSRWFQNCYKLVEGLDSELEVRLVKSIRDFMSYSDLRQLLCMVAAHFMFPPDNPDTRESLRKAFMALDLDRDGRLDRDEFGYLLEKHGAPEQIDTIFAMVDYESQGYITWTNFVGLCVEAILPMDAKLLKATFDYLSHGSHHVSTEYVNSLVPKHRRAVVEETLKNADTDSNGYLEKVDFLRLAVPGVDFGI